MALLTFGPVWEEIHERKQISRDCRSLFGLALSCLIFMSFECFAHLFVLTEIRYSFIPFRTQTTSNGNPVIICIYILYRKNKFSRSLKTSSGIVCSYEAASWPLVCILVQRKSWHKIRGAVLLETQLYSCCAFPVHVEFLNAEKNAA